ncbi:ABC transporter permease [Brevibacterium sp. 91QC2O2]|jgi:osmoprotectant transport system permease protein|uniref:ABC transporter permease n=1 Tax=Brevibacterium TaxID=1696 RepID=UPI00211CF85E|nr:MULTISPECIES: ABC transporter permease [unclassified Brevibacterium]MCQ9367148.1 ABC transporter permease [Brevibacterium sp. 91QC2O2]MCQ9385405.1 ABC transporter permease [Brevibacterium sp. 68QC2CO]
MESVFGAFPFIANNLGLLLEKTGEHLVISLIPIAAAIIVGVPLGVWLGHIHRGEFLAVSVTNIGRALPSLALVAILIGLVGIGMLNAVIALFLLAFPPILSYAFQAVDSVDRDLSRAARGMGMTPLQVLTRVELPLGLPMIISGIRTSVVLTVSSATVATIAGSGGLGDIILNQVAYGMAGVVAGALWVALLAILLDQLLAWLLRAVSPSGVKYLQAAG